MNSLLQPSPLPFQLPEFEKISVSDFLPAITAGIQEQREEIDAIVHSPDQPTWENTVEALEKSGRTLNRALAVFFNLHGTDSSEEMDQVAEKAMPLLSAHSDSIYLNQDLYQRIKEVTAPDDTESQRLHQHLLRQFRRAGAELTPAEQRRMEEINERLSVLSDTFGKNLLDSTKKLAVGLQDVSGFSERRKQVAAQDATALGREAEGYVIPLQLPTVQAAQTELTNAASRRALYEASQKRGAANTEVLLEMVRLRAERANLLGYASHADYVIEEETAGTAAAARALLHDLAPAASANAAGEYKLIAEMAEQEGGAKEEVTGADWPYWESKLRERDFALDEEELKNYFPLSRVLKDGVFYAANRLYGITVTPRTDLKGYREDVDVYEVKDADGSSIGLFLTDYYARPSKRGGAWMSSFVDQSELLGTKPVIINVMNLVKPTDGSEVLLSLDELSTIFHEFGHGLHGLLSAVRYPSFSGTNVPRDYVEFPSQINENWALDPAILNNYAFHVDTGAPIPQELVNAIHAAEKFGQGFSTSEYLAAAIIDMAWHSLSLEEAQQVEDIEAFEAQALKDAGLQVEHLKARYQSRYFNHIFAGGYSAGYYSYLWAEALDADGFEWFTESGAAGDAETVEAARKAGERFRELVLSKGGSMDYTAAFEALRGREKDLGPLLARRGLGGSSLS